MTCFFIVYHHGGKIEASSSDRGTVFTLRIPANPLLKALPPDDQEFLHRVLLNESLWERLLAEN
jgi:hypothetical protein